MATCASLPEGRTRPPIDELKQVDKPALAEETRARLPGKSPQELNCVLPDTFSNVGLCNFISIHAGQVVREAYRLATQLAPQAESIFSAL